MLEWLSAVSSATFKLVSEATEAGPVIEGGHNQLAIDSLGAVMLSFGGSYTHRATKAVIFSLPMTVLNGGVDCCRPKDALVLHFKGDLKKLMLGSCCVKASQSPS